MNQANRGWISKLQTASDPWRFAAKSQASLLRDNAAHQSPATHRNN